MSDELLRAMADAYFSASGPSDVHFGLEMAAMRAVLDVLHANGYRRCAEGQKVTQYCSAWAQANKACRDLTEKVIPNIRERAEKAEAEVERLRAERDDDRRRDYGYSQQTVDAITREREQLRAEVERLRAELDEIASVLPGVAYMDPPDGGSPSIAEQVGRMRADLDRTAAEVERLRNGRAILMEEIEMLRERVGNAIDSNDYRSGI